MPDFSISQELIGADIDLIKVSGFLDAHTFERLEETVNNIFAQARFKLVIDMVDVDYISSAGVGVLMGSQTEADENGGKVVLLNPANSVVEILDALGLRDMFAIVADRGQAAAAF